MPRSRKMIVLALALAGTACWATLASAAPPNCQQLLVGKAFTCSARFSNGITPTVHLQFDVAPPVLGPDAFTLNDGFVDYTCVCAPSGSLAKPKFFVSTTFTCSAATPVSTAQTVRGKVSGKGGSKVRGEYTDSEGAVALLGDCVPSTLP